MAFVLIFILEGKSAEALSAGSAGVAGFAGSTGLEAPPGAGVGGVL